jgi:predicted metal-dependent hydrolase
VKVEVVRSARRRKTVQARQVGGVLRISIPASMTAADEQRWVAEMVRRMERQTAGGRIDLAARADALAARYDLRRPDHIRWVDNQEWRWGSCTPSDRTVRISSRLIGEPGWVLDYVIVHELAHLSVARHDARFWALVGRYPRAERARGFLMARGMDPDVEGDSPGEPGPPAWPDQPRRHLQPAEPVLAAARRRPARRSGSPNGAVSAPRLPGF